MTSVTVMTAFDPNTEPFYAAVTGGRFDSKRYEVSRGVILQPTYAHVFASYMVAFGRPEVSGKHHPGPWHAAGHDLGFDCEFEIFVDSSATAGSIGRLNLAWLCIALLRLKLGLTLRAPIIANKTFAAPPAEGARGLAILPMETSSTQWPLKQTMRHVLRKDDLDWLREQYPKALRLMSDPVFARSFHTYDGAAWQPSIPAAVLSLCSALEALMRPGRRDMTKRLARIVATYLSEEAFLRDLHYKMVLDVFAYRGGAAHAAKLLPIEIWHATQLLVRPVLIQCLEKGDLPDPAALEAGWHRVPSEP